ncbi:hypothetical protein [Herbiconiux moechotypicola]
MNTENFEDRSTRRGFLALGGLTAAGFLTTSVLEPAGAAHAATTVSSVNGKSGDVVLTSADVAAAPANEGDPTTIVAHPSRFSGIDPTGSADSSAGLQAALAATPDGGTLIIPAGRYRMDGQLSVGAERSVSVVANGATLVQNTANPLFNVGGSYSAVVKVTSISNQNVTSDAGAVTEATVITTATTQPWVRGDVIKLVSDDLIETARPGGGGSESRIGEFVVVRSVSGTTVTLASRVRENYVTNIRAARISQKTFSLDGGTYETTATGLTKPYGTMFFFYRLRNPRVTNITVRQASSIVLSFTSCFGYTVQDVDIAGAVDRVGNNQIGYAVHDASSSFGRVIGGVFRHVRHAFTDDSPRVAANADLLTSYGRSYAAHIIGGSAIGTTSNAWDTHHCSEGIEFISCSATGGVAEENAGIAGFALRGINHRVVNCTTRNTNLGVLIFTEGGGGQSYGHVVDNLVVRNAASWGLNVNVNQAGHPSANTRDVRENVHVDGLVVIGGPRFIAVSNGIATVKNSKYVVEAGTDGQTYDGLLTKNSKLNIDNMVLDYEANTKGTPRPIIATSSAGFTPGTQETNFNRIEIRATSSVASRASRALNGGSHDLRGKNLTFSYPFTVMPGERSAKSVINWECTAGSDVVNGDLNSAYVYVSGTDLTKLLDRVVQSPDPHVMVRGVLGSANQTTLTFPQGNVRGQLVTVWMAENSSGSLKVKHGNTYRTILVAGADKVLRKSSQMRFVWDGTLWRELA